MRRPTFLLATLVAALCLSASVALAQPLPTSGVTILVNRDSVNVRLLPALGAEIIGFVNAGYTAEAVARSPDNEWVRVNFSGEEGWIGTAVLTVLAGDINSLPVADPRTIPYGGFESPRAGTTGAGSPITGKLADSGVRVRAGPSRAYAIFANAPRYTILPLLGRTFNNAWYQVNYNGTLGWIAARYVTLQGAFDITALPIDGIVADTVIPSQATADDYYALLRYMLARIDLAQDALDGSRAIWTNVALGGRSSCADLPARPTDINIPNPMLAAFYNTLDPLQKDFNIAMANVRLSVELWVDICNHAQPADGSVGQATVQGALLAINTADAQFIELRRRINELLPPILVPGADECLFTFKGASDILPLLQLGRVYVDRFVPKRTIAGYCFDGTAGQTVVFQVLLLRGNISLFLASSPVDNPTAFIALGRQATGQNLITLGPAILPVSGRYLLLVNDIGGEQGERSEPPSGEFAVLIRDALAITALDPAQTTDLETGQPRPDIDVAQFIFLGGAGTGLQPLVPTIQEGAVPATIVPTQEGSTTATVTCPSLAFSCSQLSTCETARACYQAGNFTLDPDGDGIPCEENLCTS